MAGPKIVLRFSAFVCLSVHSHLIRAQITSFLTVQLQSTGSYWRFVSKCSFVLPRWQKVAGWFLDTKYQTCLLTQVMLVTMLEGMML